MISVFQILSLRLFDGCNNYLIWGRSRPRIDSSTATPQQGSVGGSEETVPDVHPDEPENKEKKKPITLNVSGVGYVSS